MGVENLKEDKKIIVVVGVHGNKANKILEQIVANFACAYPKNTTCRKNVWMKMKKCMILFRRTNLNT